MDTKKVAIRSLSVPYTTTNWCLSNIKLYVIIFPFGIYIISAEINIFFYFFHYVPRPRKRVAMKNHSQYLMKKNTLCYMPEMETGMRPLMTMRLSAH